MVSCDHQDARDMLIVEGIKENAPVATVLDEMVFAQNAQLMGNRGSVDSSCEGKIANAELAITERGQHSLAGRIAEHREKPGHFTIPGD